jgi:DNA-binding SARP family transcriptional activator
MPDMPNRVPVRAADPGLGGSPTSTGPDLPAHSGADSADLIPPGPSNDCVPRHPRRRRPRLIVAGVQEGVAASGPMAGAGRPEVMPEYPVQLSKIQPPPLREETLARDRLLDWLSVKIHRRVVLLVAEAGYGKTTLLADFTRRTRVRMLWYRLDRGDRDWVGFIAHLVAAIRPCLPQFGQATLRLIETEVATAPRFETLIDSLLKELNSLRGDGWAVVFDDFHLVDDSPEIRGLVRELLARAPERISFVFATRREPPLRLARMRVQGELAELRTDDLRFDSAETELLFRETYDIRLEPTVLAELSRRTEGWAASLQLVRNAVHDRDPVAIRAFISSITGGEGHLYSYLAEEVVGDLPDKLQEFLMRTSVLETIDYNLGSVASGTSQDQTRAFIDEAERLGLLGRGGGRDRNIAKAHPLVRDFLRTRLYATAGQEGVSSIHLRVAKAAEGINWQIAARHYLAGGDESAAERSVEDSLGSILASGAYEAAQQLAPRFKSGTLPGSAGLVIRSRIAQQRAAREEGLKLAEAAIAAEPNSTAALINLLAARLFAGDVAGSLQASYQLESASDGHSAALGRSFRLLYETSTSGSLDVAARELEGVADLLRDGSESHFLGVALLNLALLRASMDEIDSCISATDEAISLLAASSAGVELVSARLARAWGLACRGDLVASRMEMVQAKHAAPAGGIEVAIEIGFIEAVLGDVDLAREADLEPGAASNDQTEQMSLTRAALRIREGDLIAAERELKTLVPGIPRSTPAFDARRLLTTGLLQFMRRDAAATEIVQAGIELALRQGARLWVQFGALLLALATPLYDPSSQLVQTSARAPYIISMLAEAVLMRLKDLTSEARKSVEAEAERRPERWRDSVRRLLGSADIVERRSAARLLERVGDLEDVKRLHNVNRKPRDGEIDRHAHLLARRLASLVLVEDLGRIKVRVGERVVDGAVVRRKVLALLCFLLSRPGFASTRDEVIDALWPESDPSSALNSLNQTVYFLRRLFEPSYAEQTSPGYLGQDGETVWLDRDLVNSRSNRCLAIIRSVPAQPAAEAAVSLANEYAGRFALDFAYEDWGASFRDSLHAGYLRVMEQAIRMDTNNGQFSRGTFLAERAAEVDPDAEEIQVALVRLYRMSGAHAAAAEQYGHYTDAMRELGVEPVAVADI